MYGQMHTAQIVRAFLEEFGLRHTGQLSDQGWFELAGRCAPSGNVGNAREAAWFQARVLERLENVQGHAVFGSGDGFVPSGLVPMKVPNPDTRIVSSSGEGAIVTLWFLNRYAPTRAVFEQAALGDGEKRAHLLERRQHLPERNDLISIAPAITHPLAVVGRKERVVWSRAEVDAHVDRVLKNIERGRLGPAMADAELLEGAAREHVRLEVMKKVTLPYDVEPWPLTWKVLAVRWDIDAVHIDAMRTNGMRVQGVVPLFWNTIVVKKHRTERNTPIFVNTNPATPFGFWSGLEEHLAAAGDDKPQALVL